VRINFFFASTDNEQGRPHVFEELYCALVILALPIDARNIRIY